MRSRYTIKGSFRRAARLGAVQLAYQIEQSDGVLESVISDFEECLDESSRKRVDLAFVRALLCGVYDHEKEIDQCVRNNLKPDSPLERMPPVLRAILRVALFEMFFMDTPRSVLINEYIEITKEFFTESEVAFVNGFLDNISIPDNFQRAVP
ncbi:MAG: transcription antitermination factor NusB [Holosporales bacterium]|jgi:N utilization substance protein B|nr:transcription antitermination factor NusB [Holosporales bacterium]